MPTLQELTIDPRFSHISTQTKQEIINTITVGVGMLKQEGKYTEEQLTQALHYLLAKKAKTHTHVARLLVKEQPSHTPSNISINSPFYFGNNDPFLWYWLGHNSASGGMGSGDWIGGGNSSGDCKCSGECCCVATVVTAACLSACCCVLCIKETVDSDDNDQAKTAKVTGAVLAGAAVFTALEWYFIANNVWRESLVNDHQWDLPGYYTFLTFIAGSAACLTSGLVATVSNMFPCPPEEAQPAPEVLAALRELVGIDKLLTHGWSPREGDSYAESDAFVREAILAQIKSLAYADVRITIAPPEFSTSVSSSRFSAFNQPLLAARISQPSPPGENGNTDPSAPEMGESSYRLLSSNSIK